MKLNWNTRFAAMSLEGMAGVVGIALLAACSSSSGGAEPTDGDAATTDGGGVPEDATSGDTATTPQSDSGSNTGCQATVTQGPLVGKLTGATCEYLGVPYAAPPTGSLRFMPPQAPANWSTPRMATTYGASCPQAMGALSSGIGTTSEDCLFVNVFTPQAAPSTPLPVMVFIYGGAFTSGSSTLYNGQPLSEKGPAVIVSMNYRLGALGFLALPELDATRSGAPSGSDGIRDQQLALKWVKANIAMFHGDPANVTVFGESAGGTSTCIHIVSPGSQGLANRYIIESGLCVGIAPELTTQAQAYQIGAELAASVCAGDAGAGDAGATIPSDAGSADGGGSDILSCLRAADAQTIISWLPPAGAATSASGALLGNLLGPPFSATIEGPGGVLPDTPANLIASGSFNKNAAVLAGTNKDEWGLFVDLATNTALGGSSSSPLNVTTVAQLNQGIVAQYGSSAAAQVEALYPATDATAAQVFVDLVTDTAFRCPARDLVRSLLANGTPSSYLYSYEIGKAWHSFELVPLFDLTALTAIGATMPSKGYTDEMLGYWTQFAATGNPNAPGDAGSPAWPSYAATSDEYLELLDPTPTANAHLRQSQCDFWASFKPDAGP